MTQPLALYNTLTRKKEPLQPLKGGRVGMYVCGPTVYNRPHLGNARSVVVYDVLYRLLMHIYGEGNVTYVRNITDVDDKINAAAMERGVSIQQLTQEVTAEFHADIDALNVLPSTEREKENNKNTSRLMAEPRATLHIEQMIKIIEQLFSGGHAYAAEGHVLFSVKSDPRYGQLSGRVLEELKPGERVAVESYKRDAGDFVLWKPADAEDDPSSIFDSPWGKGRPGWHIECSAMSSTYLGHDFDIHGGGADLMFPHHENEIAQSCCAKPGSRYASMWVHNGFLTVNGEKMSKSLGNFITVRDLLDKGVHGEVIRLAFLKTRYSEPLDWNDKLLSDAKLELDYLYNVISHFPQLEMQNTPAVEVDSYLTALLDDLNTYGFFTELTRLANDTNKLLFMEKREAEALAVATTLITLGRVLGIFSVSPEEWFKGTGDNSAIDALVAARVQAKKDKNWAEADRIRDELAAQGIQLEDKPGGTTNWRKT